MRETDRPDTVAGPAEIEEEHFLNRALDRRSLLKSGAAGMLALGGLAAAGPAAAASDSLTLTAKTGEKWSIALSNAYIGNDWRKQMAEAANRAADEMKKKGFIAEFSAVHGTDNAVDKQIAVVNDMILKQNDGILLLCSSGTQVNGVIDRATRAGVKVVSFDAYATSSKSWNIGFDFGEWGRKNALFMEKLLGGRGKAKGNILVVRLSLGAVAGRLIYNEYKKMLARNPGLKLVGEVEGAATRSIAQKAVSQILPNLPKIDGVLGAGGNDSFGIVEGFRAAGIKDKDIPPIATGADGDFIQFVAKQYKARKYQHHGLNAQPEIGAWAVYFITKLLNNGWKTPQDYYAPSVPTTSQTAAKYKNVKGQRIPVQTFTYAQVPAVFKKTAKLPG